MKILKSIQKFIGFLLAICAVVCVVPTAILITLHSLVRTGNIKETSLDMNDYKPKRK
jgi:hypothetical protein